MTVARQWLGVSCRSWLSLFASLWRLLSVSTLGIGEHALGTRQGPQIRHSHICTAFAMMDNRAADLPVPRSRTKPCRLLHYRTPAATGQDSRLGRVGMRICRVVIFIRCDRATPSMKPPVVVRSDIAVCGRAMARWMQSSAKAFDLALEPSPIFLGLPQCLLGRVEAKAKLRSLLVQVRVLAPKRRCATCARRLP